MKRGGPLRVDPEKTRAWQERSRAKAAENARNKPRKPLQRTELKRTAMVPKAGSSPKRRPAPKKDTPELVAAKAERRLISNDVCEVDGCGDKATHFHHAWLRSQGGPHVWWNLRHICQPHHLHVHANPEDSYRKGYMLRRSDGLAEQQRRADEHAALTEGEAA